MIKIADSIDKNFAYITKRLRIKPKYLETKDLTISKRLDR